MRTALTRALRVLAESLVSSTTARHAVSAFQTGVRHFRQAATLSNAANRAVHAMFEPLEQRALMSTYFISLGGNDSNSGTSPGSAWRSIDKVSGYHFHAGDSILFQGGETFYGALKFFGDGGTASDPVTVGSYDSGQATINSGTSTGAWLLNDSGITINNLKFVGTAGDTGSQDGIRIENYTANSTQSGITVNDCDISGYAEGGIVFGSDAAGEGLNNIKLTDNNIYNNIMTGIESYAIVSQGNISSETNTNILISGNQVHNNYGDGKSVNTGDGIMLQGLNGATIEYNSAYDNGATGGQGEVGIWTYSSNDVLVQYNQSYDNRTVNNDDGDAFDFDADTSNSVMQYNHAYDNDGGGFQLNQWWNDNDETGDIIRYNISQNNGRKNNYSGIDVWGKVENAQIYNNTVYNTPAITGTTSAIRISNNETGGLLPSNIRIANNIFVTTGGTPLVDLYGGAFGAASSIHLTGNVYYSYSGATRFVWGSSVYNSLSGFQAGTGEEKLNGAAVGLYANPDLVAPGMATAQPSAFSISQVTQYGLDSDSPIADAGVILGSATGFADIGKTVPGVDQSIGGAVTYLGATVPTTTNLPSPVVPTPVTVSTTSQTAPTSSSAINVINTPVGTSTTPGSIGQSYLSGYDIGNPNKGSNTISGSTDVLTGGGAEIGGTSDSFRYATTTLTGNGQIVAEVSSLSNPSGSAAAGLMIRNSLAANSATVALMFNNLNQAYFLTRSSTGAAMTSAETATAGDKWIKLVRRGNTFAAYLSSNGTSWVLVGVATIDMAGTIDIGLAASAQNMSTTETAVFNNVKFSGTIS